MEAAPPAAPPPPARRRAPPAAAALVAAALVALAAAAAARRRGAAPLAVLSPEELARGTGAGGGRVLLAVLGNVFDVTAGRRHYGPGGAYAFFAGRDASRAYATGDFRGDLTDDLEGLDGAAVAEVARWRAFFRDHETYRHVGYVTGRFRDAGGRPTPALAAAEAAAAAAPAAAAVKDSGAPGAACRVSYSAAQGGSVWCADGAVPRRVALDDGRERCRCLAGGEAAPTAARRLYHACAPDAARCATSPPAGS